MAVSQFKVGDKVRFKGGAVRLTFTVTEVFDEGWVYRTLTERDQLVLLDSGCWNLANNLEPDEPPKKRYKVYKEVEAANETEARRMLGESYMVEQVK